MIIALCFMSFLIKLDVLSDFSANIVALNEHFNEKKKFLTNDFPNIQNITQGITEVYNYQQT